MSQEVVERIYPSDYEWPVPEETHLILKQTIDNPEEPIHITVIALSV